MIDKFYYQIPYNPKTDKIGQGETGELHMKKTIITTEFHFPYVLKRIPVIQKKVIVITPIEMAISALQERIAKLKEELNRDGGANTKTLSQVLQGSVLVTVNEGTLTYAKVFLGNPHNYPHNFVEDLRDTFLRFLEVCKKALEVHGKHVTGTQKEFQLQMEGGYLTLSSTVTKYIEELNKKFSFDYNTSTDATEDFSDQNISPVNSPSLLRKALTKNK